MNNAELIKQLEAIIEVEKAKSTRSGIEEEQKDPIQEHEIDSTKINEESSGFWHSILHMIMSPFLFLAKYFKIEITGAIKHDLRRTGLMIFLSMILFIFLIVIWITVQYSIITLLITQGFSLLNALFISLGIQVVCFSIVVLIINAKSKRMETLKLFRRLKQSTENDDEINNKASTTER
jgi:hypothetical protein